MTSPHITVVTKDNFEEEVLKAGKMVLIDFYADWCGPCKALAPTLEKFAEENQATVKVVKVNVDDSPEVAGLFQVQSIPTLFTMSENKVIGKMQGNRPKSEIEAFVKKSQELLTQQPPATPKTPKNNGLKP